VACSSSEYRAPVTNRGEVAKKGVVFIVAQIFLALGSNHNALFATSPRLVTGARYSLEEQATISWWPIPILQLTLFHAFPSKSGTNFTASSLVSRKPDASRSIKYSHCSCMPNRQHHSTIRR